MNQEIAVRELQSISPKEFEAGIEEAHQKALILKGIVDSQKLSVKLGQSEHLRVEAWITIGKGYGYTARSEVLALIRSPEGIVEGVQARATVVDSLGVAVGGAESFCFADEEGKSKQSVAQLSGMAQTRAVSRAFRELLSWVVVLAGYSATPAEEVTSGQVDSKVDPTMMCPLHQVEWFKKGKMKGFAHPIGDTGTWCNKDDVEPPVSSPPTPDTDNTPTLASRPLSAPFRGVPDTLAGFMEWARDTHGYTDRDTLCKAMGCEKPVDILKMYKTWDKAMEDLNGIHAEQEPGDGPY
tara:strand:- start:30634 stop:31521 length:888 start_codon:yes stop_codon:yes gene_type:complete